MIDVLAAAAAPGAITLLAVVAATGTHFR